MGTEVLRPQDCLGDRFGICPPAFHRRRSYFSNGNGFGGNTRANNNGCRRPLNRPERLDQKKKPNREPQQSSSEIPFQIPKKSSSATELRNHLNNKQPANHHFGNEIESGRVMILRRGQSFDSFDAKMKKENHNNYNRTREGGIMKKKLNMSCGYGDEVMYAGSAFSVSPSPSALPLPSFFNNNNNNKGCGYDDSATRDLRRLLRLE